MFQGMCYPLTLTQLQDTDAVTQDPKGKMFHIMAKRTITFMGTSFFVTAVLATPSVPMLYPVKTSPVLPFANPKAGGMRKSSSGKLFLP